MYIYQVCVEPLVVFYIIASPHCDPLLAAVAFVSSFDEFRLARY